MNILTEPSRQPPGLTAEERLQALRDELSARSLDGFVIPLTDEHMSEYVGRYARRLAWLTGFEGSAGTAVVLLSEAAIFVDGRYTLQVREQADTRIWSCQSVLTTNIVEWIQGHASAGARIGYDPWLHTTGWVTSTRLKLARHRIELLPVNTNPVDAVWADQPKPSSAPVFVHPDRLAGKSAAQKLQGIAAWLKQEGAEATILCALDSIAWTFNIRGSDVERTPVALAYAVIYSDATAELFIVPEKLSPEIRVHLGSAVQCRPRSSFSDHLRSLADKSIAVDPERAVTAIFESLRAVGATVLECRDPTVLPKAIKNNVEITGQRAAHARDGAALSRFLHWLSIKAPQGAVSELSAAAELQRFREATGCLHDLSFNTISGFGPNAAIVHYGVSEKTNRTLTPGSLYLVDSGGQYVDGTTDVTRTIAIGVPTAEMRDRFTRVLKGHILLATSLFPAGIRGGQIDALARRYLWDVGLDYAHGTGHGVGSFLSVHEGPQRIINPQAPVGGGDEPLIPGMIVSNEPGYYKTGEYGIRIENLMLVVERPIDGGEQRMLGFEILTQAPIDRTLIEPALLTAEERAWLDSYHREVMRVVGPQLDGPAKAWLIGATQPL